MKSMWISLLLIRCVLGRVLDRLGVTGAECDVARRVLVEQRVEEHRLERADPPVAVDERDLPEPRAAVVLRAGVAQRVGVVVRVDLDRAPALELDPDPVEDRAVELERHRRAHVAVDPERIGCRERLLARDVREVADPVDRLEAAGLPT